MPEWLDLTIDQRDDIVRQFTQEGEERYLQAGKLNDCPHKGQKADWWRRGFMNAMLGMQLAGKV